jgi:hypothetical protein
MITDAQVADHIADWLRGSLGAVEPTPEFLARVARDVAASAQARSRWLPGGWRGAGWTPPGRVVRASIGVAIIASAGLAAVLLLGPRPAARPSVGAAPSPSTSAFAGLPAPGPLTSQVPGGPVHGTPPTVGLMPDDPDAPLPDFIPVTYRDRDGIAGYVATRDLFQEGTVPWWYQEPPTPVYADDLWTLVGFMFPGKGFVPLGVDPNTVAGAR